MGKKNDRFVEVYRQSGMSQGTTKILVDARTGVSYLWHTEGYGGGLTPLLDREGKPVLVSTGSGPEL